MFWLAFVIGAASMAVIRCESSLVRGFALGVLIIATVYFHKGVMGG